MIERLFFMVLGLVTWADATSKKELRYVMLKHDTRSGYLTERHL